MTKKFNIDNSGSVELSVDGSIDVLTKVQGKGWVVERKLLNMMALMSDTNEPSSYDNLLKLEEDRPEWGGVFLSLFDESQVLAH